MKHGNKAGDWLVQFIAVVLGGVFLVCALVYLWFGCRPVTHLDFWRIYDVCLTHGWFESALLKHNGHSLFFPSFVWLADLRFFHGNQELIFYAGSLFLISSTVLLCIPIWRDPSIGRTPKIMAMLVILIGTFWMGRAAIITSGGFMTNASLVMIGAETSLLCLALMRQKLLPGWLARVGVVAGGLVATFSFGVGLAVWPTLLYAAWSLRLRVRCYLVIICAAIVAVIIFIFLPPRDFSPSVPVIHLSFSAFATALEGLCRLVSAPLVYAAAAWQTKTGGTQPSLPGSVGLLIGIALLAGAAVVLVRPLIRRTWVGADMEFIGTILVVFNLFASLLIVIGRAEHLENAPFEIAAPRYFFHTTLFLTGLLLLLIRQLDGRARLRWPMYGSLLALTVFFLPAHREAGLRAAWANLLMRNGAVALTNGVRDDNTVRSLFHAPPQVYHVAAELRRQRLDMFRLGLQDWIGQNEAQVFAKGHARRGLQGRCRIRAVVQSDTGEPAARVTGSLWYKSQVLRTAVIVDQAGVVCGVCRSFHINRLLNKVFFHDKLGANTSFIGYIRSYDPQQKYWVRGADGGFLSEESVAVTKARR